MSRDGFLTIAEVAGKMTVSEATVWALVKRREVDRFKFPGDRRTYVKADALATLMEPERIGGPGRPRGTGDVGKTKAAA